MLCAEKRKNNKLGAKKSNTDGDFCEEFEAGSQKVYSAKGKASNNMRMLCGQCAREGKGGWIVAGVLGFDPWIQSNLPDRLLLTPVVVSFLLVIPFIFTCFLMWKPFIF